MRLSEIEFGSLLTYSPRGRSRDQRLSRTVMRVLKNDEYLNLENDQIMMSDYLADRIKNSVQNLPFADYFDASPVLVPVPNSSLNKSGTLWVPQRLASALAKKRAWKQSSRMPQPHYPAAKICNKLR